MTDVRKSPRSALNGILCIQLEPNNHAIVLDISDEGLGFHAVYPVTQSGTIRFSFKQQSGGRIEATGELAWLDSAKKTGGLRFVSLAEASRDQIRKLSAEMAVPVSPRAPFVPSPPPPPSLPLPPPLPSEPKEASPSVTSLPPEPQLPAPQAPAVESLLPEPADAATPPATATSAGAVVPAFVLFGSNSPYGSYASGEGMPVSSGSSKFFRGFVSGVIVAAILVAIAYVAMGNPVGYLRTLMGSYTGAKSGSHVAPAASPTPVVPAASPTTSAPQPLSSVPLPPAADGQALADSNPSRDFAANTSANPSASPAPPAPEPAQQPSAAQSSASASEISTVELGNLDLARAQRYLNEDGGPNAQAAAANLLWAAVGAGNVRAEIRLAELYAHGSGVAKNCDQARILVQAAERSNGEAPPELAQFIQGGCR